MKAFHLPNRLIRLPTIVDDSSRPTIIGRVSRPDSVGVAPRASCMYWPRKTDVPNIATPTEMEAMTASVKVRFLNIASGMIGSFTTSSVMTVADQQRDRAADHPDGLCAPPVELRAGQRDPDEQQRDAAGEEDRAEVVDADLARGALRELERDLQQDDRDDGDRDADEEVPAPADRVGEEAADQRAADRADGHDAAEEAHVPATLAGADDVGHDDLAQRGQTAGAEALHHAEADQHRRCSARSPRAPSRARRARGRAG